MVVVLHFIITAAVCACCYCTCILFDICLSNPFWGCCFFGKLNLLSEENIQSLDDSLIPIGDQPNFTTHTDPSHYTVRIEYWSCFFKLPNGSTRGYASMHRSSAIIHSYAPMPTVNSRVFHPNWPHEPEPLLATMIKQSKWGFLRITTFHG